MSEFDPMHPINHSAQYGHTMAQKSTFIDNKIYQILTEFSRSSVSSRQRQNLQDGFTFMAVRF